MREVNTTAEATREFFAFRIRGLATLITATLDTLSDEDVYKLYMALKDSKIADKLNEIIKDGVRNQHEGQNDLHNCKL